jgi:hypothetical protein
VTWSSQTHLLFQVTVLKEVAIQRTGARNDLLLATEYAALENALEHAEPTLRMCNCMALAAQIGNSGEAHFWQRLPATLATHAMGRTQGGLSAAEDTERGGFQEQGLLRRASALRKGAPLHSNESILQEAAQRMAWHESAHGGSFGTGEFEAIDEDGEVRAASFCLAAATHCRCINSKQITLNLK